jgi:hypothetical protein
MSVIDLIYPNQNIKTSLSVFLAQHADTVGARTLMVLISSPGKLYDVLELSFAVDWGKANHDVLIDLLYNAYPAIPVCDAQALNAYKARLTKLDQLRAKRLETDPAADCTELDWETAFLKAEIRNATKPRGGIKNFRQTKKRAYNRLRLALTRLLRRVDDPFLYGYIQHNLKTGLGFVWLGGENTVSCLNVDEEIAA